MKIYISKYRNHWISPYTILETICFWEKDKDIFYNLEDKPTYKYEKWINFLTPICRFIQNVLDIFHPRIQYIKIDHYDTWSMDTTLAPIILPMLKQLKETKHGSAIVDLEDVPKHLQTTNTQDFDDQIPFDWYIKDEEACKQIDVHKRWDWVLDEMIWAFEQICDDDNDAQFHTGTYDTKSIPCEWDENGKPTLFELKETDQSTHHFDIKGYQKHNARINNGTRLFGKYFRNLWD